MCRLSGEAVGSRGENGSGKTSLLRIFSSLLPPEDGSVRWEGQDIQQLKELYSGQLMYLGHLNGIKDDLTAVENLMSSMALAGEPCSERGAKEALEAIGLKRVVHRLPSKVLSQGQNVESRWPGCGCRRARSGFWTNRSRRLMRHQPRW